MLVTRWIRRKRRGGLQAVLVIRVDGERMCGSIRRLVRVRVRVRVLVLVLRVVDMLVGVEVGQPRHRLLLRVQTVVGRLVERVQCAWMQRSQLLLLHRRRRLLHDGAQFSAALTNAGRSRGREDHRSA